jgi:hypothetical protein
MRPIDVMSYLRAAGWLTQSELGDKGVIVTKGEGLGEQELLVPMRRDLADFAIRMAEVLAGLERVESRSQEEILRDILTTSFDLIRVRSASTSAADGSIPIGTGVSLFEQARDMMLAAACSTVSPKAYWARRRPPKATGYLEGVRLGQTERGSYVLTIQSPVPPAFKNALFEDVDVPFERQVSETLVHSLVSVKDAARQFLISREFEPFRRAVDSGVSANLCDALVALASAAPETGIEISVTYSPNRPPAQGGSHVVTAFSPDLIPVIEEASRVFKQTEPAEEFSLIGFVERLDRAQGTPDGRIAIRGLVDEQPRRVIVDLPNVWYQQALQAHGENRPVFCVGELVKERRSYELINPRNFTMLGDERDSEWTR